MKQSSYKKFIYNLHHNLLNFFSCGGNPDHKNTELYKIKILLL